MAEAVHCEALFSCKERLQDEIEVEFGKHDGYELIFTAPYTPKFNSIEMVWAYTKGDVAYQYKPSRTLSDTAIDIYTRWYGGTGAVDQKLKTGLTPVMAQKFVSHCKAEMNLWIDEYGESTGISGNIDALVVGDAYDIDHLAAHVDVEIIEDNED